MKNKTKGCGCDMKGMGKGYGKMEKMMGKKDVEKKGMKEGSKADMKKDISIMMGMKIGKPMKDVAPTTPKSSVNPPKLSKDVLSKLDKESKMIKPKKVNPYSEKQRKIELYEPKRGKM